jgi:cytochrome c-type biogenesis protein CcmH
MQDVQQVYYEGIMMALIRAAAFILAFSLVSPAAPQAREETAREIEGMLIAPCCWSQPVSQHYSEVADQIRKEVRQLLAAGKSKQEILDYYVAEYGERILASPRPHGFNLLAYILPVTSLLTGLVVIAVFLRKWTMRPAAALPADDVPTAGNDQYSARIERELREFE